MYKPEEVFIVKASRARLSEDAVGELRDLAGYIDRRSLWDDIVGQSYRHNILPLISRNIMSKRIYPTPRLSNADFQYAELFNNVYQANQVRNEGLLREMAIVADHFRRRGIPYVLRKGLVLGQIAYGDLGARRSYDIDFAVPREYRTEVEEELGSLGYTSGTLSSDGRTVMPRSRKEQLFWKLHIPNLSFRRVTSERFVNSFVVDVSFDQFLPGSGHKLPSSNLHLRSEERFIYGVAVRAFNSEEMLIDLCTHLFKEATSLHYLEIGKDLTISKFLDICEYISNCHVNWDEFLRLCARYEVARPAYYALHYVDVVYPYVVPERVLNYLEPDDVGYLNEYGAVDGDVRRWDEEFTTRLFNRSRSNRAPFSNAPL